MRWIDAVVIATPPRLHFPVSKAFLERGFDVMCEKPMTHDLAEAKALAAIVNNSDRLFASPIATPGTLWFVMPALW
jgi:predicted dehydrogenase